MSSSFFSGDLIGLILQVIRLRFGSSCAPLSQVKMFSFDPLERGFPFLQPINMHKCFIAEEEGLMRRCCFDDAVICSALYLLGDRNKSLIRIRSCLTCRSLLYFCISSSLNNNNVNCTINVNPLQRSVLILHFKRTLPNMFFFHLTFICVFF